MYRLAKTDRRVNSSFKKYIYIYIILFIFIYLYINTVLVEREFVRCSRRTISFFSTASRDLCLIGFAFKAAVFERAVSQTSVYDTTRTLISLHHFVSLFTFYLQRRNENPRVPFLFRQVLRLIWQWFLVKKYPKKRLELRFKCSDTGESVRQSLDEVPWPDDGSETGSSDVLQDPWNELGDPRAHPW